MSRKFFILGVGRSGTSTLYQRMQNAMLAIDKDVQFSYEPFLWDCQKLSGLYKDIYPRFTLAESVSVEAAYFHKKIPMFCSSVETLGSGELDFIKRISYSNNDCSLVKYIRGNGRLPLFRQLYPSAKFVFILRNPFDVINSVIQLFSFYGDDFYETDFNRFYLQINELFEESLVSKFKVETEVQKAFLYWYFMNKVVVDEYQRDKSNIIPIVYEDLLSNQTGVMADLLNQLGLNAEDSDFPSETVGAVLGGRGALSDDDVAYISQFQYLYAELLSDLGFETDLKDLSIVFKEKHKAGINGRVFKNLNSQSACLTLDNESRILKEKEKDLQALHSQLQEKERDLQAVHSQLQEKERDFQAVHSQLQEKKRGLQTVKLRFKKKGLVK